MVVEMTGRTNNYSSITVNILHALVFLPFYIYNIFIMICDVVHNLHSSLDLGFIGR